jgi:hypothetical protein
MAVDVAVEEDAGADVDTLGDAVLEDASAVRVLETDDDDVDDDEAASNATLKPRLGDITEAGLAWI